MLSIDSNLFNVVLKQKIPTRNELLETAKENDALNTNHQLLNEETHFPSTKPNRS